MENFTHFAYIDPGTGSLVLQAIVGGILGLVVVLRMKIKMLIFKIKSLGKKDTDKKAD
jgi:hypothetical protein